MFPSSHLGALTYYALPPPPTPPFLLAGTAGRAAHPFTWKLQAMAGCRPAQPTVITPALAPIVTPMHWQTWKLALTNHPDQEFADLVVSGVRDGFRIGFNYTHLPLTTSCKRNMKSAYDHPRIVSEYLQQELAQGHILGPFQNPPCHPLTTSSFGVIPKRHQPGKWRLIVDLSSPVDHSVNDGIDARLCSLTYVSVDDIAAALLRLGRGALIAKADIKSAYRQVPVHPDDRHLLGLQWQGQYYIDAVLPFGLRSAPIIFSAVAEALEWIIRNGGVELIFHYIDDFVVLGPPQSEACERGLLSLIQTCASLGLIVADEKTEGPSTCLTVLGIEFDTVAMELRLPREKLSRLHSLLHIWHGKKSGTRRDLESLAGTLQHASKVVQPGRIFIRRIYNLLAQTSNFKPHYSIRLNAECQADIEWWHTFIQAWNGTSILSPLNRQSPDVHLWSDASGSWGCGAYWQGLWFQVPWGTLPIASESIAPKEFFPIMVACIVWGKLWRGCTVCCHCDNSAVVSVINAKSAKEPLICHMIRCLFFASAHFQFNLFALHTPGVTNEAADALSRNNLSSFNLQVPNAERLPTPVPHSLCLGLSVARPQWRSLEWREWFRSIFSRL